MIILSDQQDPKILVAACESMRDEIIRLQEKSQAQACEIERLRDEVSYWKHKADP